MVLRVPKYVRAAIYARVSTEEQAEEGHSIDAQLRICRELCATRKWTIVGEYVDAGISGTTLDRARFQDLLRDIRAGKIDVIVVHKLDRFSRSLVDTLVTLAELSQRGVSFCSATEQFDFTTPIGKVLLALLAAFAQYFVDNLREETKKGLRQRALKGFYNGLLPFGYQAVPKDEGGVPVFHQENIKGYRTAVQWGADGKSLREIADWLNDQGYRTTGNRGRNLFNPDSVRDILKSRFYLGEVSYKGVWRKGQHPAAIDLQTWQACQEQLRRRSVRREGTKPSDRVYPLRKLLHCAVCGSGLRGQPARKVRLYRDVQASLHRCSEPQTVNAEEVETQVGTFLTRVALPADWKEQILKQIDAAADAEEVESKRRALIAQMTRSRNLYIHGDLADPEYQKEKQRIELGLSKLQAVAMPDLEKAAQLLNTVGTLWQHATDRERLELARSLFEKLYLRQGQLVACEPRAPLYPLFVLGGDKKISDRVYPVGNHPEVPQARERRASIPSLPTGLPPVIVILPPGVDFTEVADGFSL